MRVSLDVESIRVRIQVDIPHYKATPCNPLAQESVLIQRSIDCKSRKEVIAAFQLVIDEFLTLPINDEE